MMCNGTWIAVELRGQIIRFILIGGLLRLGFSFNLEERMPVVRRGENGTQFGFTVAQYIDADSGRSSLLVGAPRTQTEQPNVFRGGAVFLCPVDSPNCQQIPFDKSGNNKEWNGSEMVLVENKTMQWFGATLVASKSGHILACAPRYVYFSRIGVRQDPVGSCFLSQPKINSFRSYSPCRKDQFLGHHRQGFCQNGFSAAFSHDGNKLIMGAVGSYYWQGQVFLADLGVSDGLRTTNEDKNSSTNDNSYMGYAVTSGNFSSGLSQDFVVGIPKGNNLTGKVLFLDSTLKTLHEVFGEQIGEYFGSSIAVADFNGDGRDDVAVGAPFYFSSASHFDVGRVYVFHQTGQSLKSLPRLLSGSQKALSRFGFALSHLGDMNLDGFGDLAVGAPYDGPDGNGAVYIFQGSLEGLRAKPSQICYAEAFGPRLSAFGFSMSGGLDLDKNGYPDLLIGAYSSDAVVYLRSRPVVKVNTEVKVNPEVIDLDDRRCKLPDGTPVTCYSITFCVSYSGLKVPAEIELRLDWQLDLWKNLSLRTAFLNQSLELRLNMTMTAYKLLKKCTSVLAYIKDSIRDKLSPIKVAVTYTLIETRSNLVELSPVLDTYARNPAVAQCHILKDCGEDLICIPDLSLQLSSSRDYYVLGTDNKVDLNVAVENSGEDAYESFVRIKLPEGVVYINIRNISASTEVVCDLVRLENSTADDVICDLGNPLPMNDRVSFSIHLSASKTSWQVKELRFIAITNSSNQENLTSFADNFQIFDIPVKAVLKIKLSGVSFPEQVLYNRTEITEIVLEEDIGPEVSHLYEIRNVGPGVVGRMRTVIKWPSRSYDGLHLFYLIKEPRIILGTGYCWADSVNPLNLTTLMPKGDNDSSDVYQRLKLNASIDAGPTNSRLKRQILPQSDSHIQVMCQDNTSGCSVIECESGQMKKDDSVVIEIRARVFSSTVTKIQTNYRGGIVVRSEAATSVLTVPYAVEPEVYLTDTFRVETFVAFLGVDQIGQPVEFWMIAIGIFFGSLLLFLLVIIMWHCGFFERETLMKLHQGRISYEPVDGEG